MSASEVLPRISLLSKGSKKRRRLPLTRRAIRFRKLLKLIRVALAKGATLREISKVLDWRDFEALSAWIFENHGFSVSRRVVLTHPRREIDIVAERGEVVLVADCKHWNRGFGAALLTQVCDSQKSRCHYLSESGRLKAGKLYPVVISVFSWERPFHEGVPIVPICKLNDFLRNFEGVEQNLWFSEVSVTIS